MFSISILLGVATGWVIRNRRKAKDIAVSSKEFATKVVDTVVGQSEQ